MRQVVLDTETTGLELVQGHRVIELGCVELVNRRATGARFHRYINPDREIEAGALDVHGISAQFLRDKPRFEDVLEEFLSFVADAELVIHNAEFDVGFLDHELQLCGAEPARIETYCSGVLDTLELARKLHPGQRNSLDALCRRYEVDNSRRELHGALLDAEILADVYLAMTGGQTELLLHPEARRSSPLAQQRRERPGERLPVIAPSAEELAAHSGWLERIERQAPGGCLWLRLDAGEFR